MLLDDNSSTKKDKPLVVIVGPTASGKTSLAIELAKKYGGEIICADSRSIYKYMDIGTAKPNKNEQETVPHWGIDLVEPGEYFSVVNFKEYALKKIDEIRSRNCMPFLVGGTGLYVDAVLFNYQFGQKADDEKRQELQHKSLAQLHDYCNKNNILLPENYKNKRYVISSIEKNNQNISKKSEPLANSIIVGISTDKSELRTKIEQRIEQLFENGVVEESIMLGKKYGWCSEAMKSNIYPLVHLYLDGKMSMDDVKKSSAVLDWRLAKRQLTWLRRNSFIEWLTFSDAKKYLADQLAIYG